MNYLLILISEYEKFVIYSCLVSHFKYEEFTFSVISIEKTDNEPKSNGTVSRFSWFKWRRSTSTQNSTEQVIDFTQNSDDMTADYLKAFNSNTEAPTTTTELPNKEMHQSFRMSSEQIVRIIYQH